MGCCLRNQQQTSQEQNDNTTADHSYEKATEVWRTDCVGIKNIDDYIPKGNMFNLAVGLGQIHDAVPIQTEQHKDSGDDDGFMRYDEATEMIKLNCFQLNNHDDRHNYEWSDNNEYSNNNSNNAHDQTDVGNLKSLVNGYVNENSDVLQVPTEIMKLILLYSSAVYKILCLGVNKYGEEDITYYRFTEINEFSVKLDSHHTNIYYGFKRYIIKNRLNELYTAGIRNYKFTKIPLQFDKDDEIDVISNGVNAYHTIIATQRGKLYAWGRNTDLWFASEHEKHINNLKAYRQRPTCYEKLNEPFVDLKDDKIIKIECGALHCIFLTKNGILYSCGHNVEGQCGIVMENNNDYIYSPTIIDIAAVKDIAVGHSHTLCLSTDSEIYHFGCSEHGALGTDDENIYIPMRIKYFMTQSNIKIIACGAFHNVCITDDMDGNACYMWGNNEYKQLKYDVNFGGYIDGDSVIEPCFWSRDILNVFCGEYHTVTLDSLNILNGFGRDMDFELELNALIDEGYENLCRVICGTDTVLLVIKEKECVAATRKFACV